MVYFLKYFTLGYWPPHEKPGSCPPAKYPTDYHDDYYSRDLYGGKSLIFRIVLIRFF